MRELGGRGRGWTSNSPLPRHAANAQALDLINALVIIPEGLGNVQLDITNGPVRHGGKHTRRLSAGRANAITVPFQAGSVHFEVHSSAGTHMRHAAQEIYSTGSTYNFNMWSGAWRVKVAKAE